MRTELAPAEALESQACEIPAGAGTGRCRAFLREAWPFLLYFAAIYACFFRSRLFFYLDEYAGIWRLAQARSTLAFICQPHNEHFIPLFHAFWAMEVFAFRERYPLYILTNVMLLALLGFLWQRWLRSIGVQPAVAALIPLAAVTCLAQADNVMCGWQACTLLSALALVCLLRAYCRGRLISVAVLACCAALAFANAYVVPLVLAGYFVFDYFRSPERRLLVAVAVLLVIFGALLAAAGWSGAVTSGGIFGAVWQGLGFFGKLAHLARLGWYTLNIAFYGPLQHLLRGVPPEGPSSVMTILSLGVAGGALYSSWRSPARHLVLKLLVLQAALFLFISPFRHTPAFVGFSGRYYTAGFVPLLSVFAVGLSAFLRRRGMSAISVGAIVLVLVLLIGVNVRRALIIRGDDNWFLVQCGRAARLDYYETKRWLRRHEQEAVGDHTFNRSVAPWLDLSRLLSVIRTLDPAFATVPRSITNVTYVENLANTRDWGAIVEEHPAVQTFQVEAPSVATKLEVLVSRSPAFSGLGRLAIADDTGRTIWKAEVPSELWPANTWLAVPVDLAPLDPGRVYSIQIASTSPDPGATITAWMNHDPGSYPGGGTHARDGTAGDLCFRLALMAQ